MTKLLLQPGRVLGLLLLVASAAFSATITIVQSVGPTVDASGKLATYLSNAEFALQNNLTSFGTVNDPVNYAAASQPIYAGSIITTPTFASWLGAASPTGAYANENGNELYFGVSIFSSTLSRCRRFCSAEASSPGAPFPICVSTLTQSACWALLPSPLHPTRIAASLVAPPPMASRQSTSCGTQA